jgi:hypothetical protein
MPGDLAMRNSHDFTNSDYSGPAPFRPEPHSGEAITAEQAWLLFSESDREDELLRKRIEVAAFVSWTLVSIGFTGTLGVLLVNFS